MVVLILEKVRMCRSLLEFMCFEVSLVCMMLFEFVMILIVVLDR